MRRIILLLLAVLLVVLSTACVPRTLKPESNSDVVGTIAPTTQAPTETPTQAQPSAITPGNFIQKTNFKFSFEKAATYNEIKMSDYYSEKPSDGKIFLLLFFEVENVSNESKYVNYFNCNAYVDNYDVSIKALLSDVENYSLLAGDLAPGKKMKGFLSYEVDKNWQNFEVTYKDGLLKSSDKYEFKVSSKDLS